MSYYTQLEIQRTDQDLWAPKVLPGMVEYQKRQEYPSVAHEIPKNTVLACPT